MCSHKETTNLNFIENLVCLRVYPSLYVSKLTMCHCCIFTKEENIK